ncbi:MAG: YjzC family protein [Caldilineaceae bacterium]
MAEKATVLKPGVATPKSGQYVVVGPRGGIVGTEVTSIQGKPLPPTPKPGQGYVLVDATKHKK